MLCFYVFLCVQILCESFPISSSGHVQLVQNILHYFGFSCGPFFGMSTAQDFQALEHYAHWLTLIILTLFFFNQWFFLLKHIKRCRKIILKIIALGIIADGITFMLYILFQQTDIAGTFPLTLGFLITALLLFSLSYIKNKRYSSLHWRSAMIIGLGQGLALMPGISRFATTYVLARWCSISARRSFDISWMLAFPLMTGAFLKSLWYIHNNITLQAYVFQLPVILIMLGAGIISYSGLCLVARLSSENKVWWFGYYMIVPIIISILLNFSSAL